MTYLMPHEPPLRLLGKSTRYERSDVLGVLEGNQIPKWAQQGLKRHQQEQQKNKTQRSSER